MDLTTFRLPASQCRQAAQVLLRHASAVLLPSSLEREISLVCGFAGIRRPSAVLKRQVSVGGEMLSD